MCPHGGLHLAFTFVTAKGVGCVKGRVNNVGGGNGGCVDGPGNHAGFADAATSTGDLGGVPKTSVGLSH